MKNLNFALVAFLVVLYLCSPTALAVRYNDGRTYNINSKIIDDVLVDYQAPGMQTTVNLLYEGAILDPYRLYGYNDSRINMSGGEVNYFTASGNSQVIMSGGWVSYQLWAYGNSQVTMSGGEVTNLSAYNNSQITMSSGGSARNFSASDSSRVTMNGGSVSYNLLVYGSSQVTISGGRVGEVLGVQQSSLVNWSGGSVGQYMEVGGMAALTIYGSNFAIDGIPFVFGEISSIFGGFYGDEPYRRLTGTLANGDIINNQFRIGDTASIVLIPEPASILLLFFGGLLASRKKQFKSK